MSEAAAARAFSGHLRDYAAILSDLDGTLVDTMPLQFAAYARMLARHGGALSRADFDALVGGPARDTIPGFVRAAGLDPAALPSVEALHAEKKRNLEAILAEGALVPLPGVAILRAARGRARIGVVTSGNRDGATAMLAALGLDALVEVLVTGDDVTRGKPDPEPYLRAAALLDVAPAACLVLEDHPAGIASGAAAGMAVLDVRTLPAQGGLKW